MSHQSSNKLANSFAAYLTVCAVLGRTVVATSGGSVGDGGDRGDRPPYKMARKLFSNVSENKYSDRKLCLIPFMTLPHVMSNINIFEGF